MQNETPSTIYGPVDSWRLGSSLGVDVLCVDSICSFECVYCQLGKINRVTLEREVFVPTERILADLKRSDWKEADVITLSGSGEPTLAKNMGEVISRLKEFTGKPVVVLTNATLLNSAEVRNELALADKVFCKLDAWTDEMLTRIDRPHEDVSLKSIVDGIVKFRDDFKGFLAIQTMILREPAESELEEFAGILRRIRPDEIQLNLPTRPIPQDYFVETRGNEVVDEPGYTHLKTISQEELNRAAERLFELTGIQVSAR